MGIKTFNIQDGVRRYFILLVMQLVLLPFFAMMECAGVSYAIYDPPIDGFFVVQKESKTKKEGADSPVKPPIRKSKSDAAVSLSVLDGKYGSFQGVPEDQV